MKKKTTEISKPVFQYHSCNDLYFIYQVPFSGIDKGKATTQVGFDLKKGMNYENKMIRILISIEFKSKIDEQNEYHLKSITEHLFHIEKLESFVTKVPDGEMLVENNLEFDILSVCYSTLRGILLEKLRNTVFNDYVLPVISVDELRHITKSNF